VGYQYMLGSIKNFIPLQMDVY